MKKLFSLILVLTLLLIPITVSAEGVNLEDYKTEDLKAALKDEDISTKNLSKYTSDDNPVNIYLFRGSGCSHCHEFLEYASSDLIKKYGSKIKFTIFEVWNDSNNSELMNNLAAFLGKEGGGVPFIIIGDKTFEGYASSMDSDIEEAINSLHESSERYDVMEKYDGTKAETTNDDSNSDDTTANDTSDDEENEEKLSENNLAGWSIVITAIASCGIVLYVNNKNKKLQVQIDELKNKKK